MYSVYDPEGDLVDTHHGYELTGMHHDVMCRVIGGWIPPHEHFQQVSVIGGYVKRTLSFHVPRSLYKGEPDLICGNCAGQGRSGDSILAFNIGGNVVNKGCVICECTQPDSFKLNKFVGSFSELEEDTSAMSTLNLFCLDYKQKVDRSLKQEDSHVVFVMFDGLGKEYAFKTAAHALIATDPNAIRLDQDFTLEEYIVNYNRGLCAYSGCAYRLFTCDQRIPSNPLHEKQILKVLQLMDRK